MSHQILAGSDLPLVVTIGISGHRKLDQLGDLEGVRGLLRERFSELDEELTAKNGVVEYVLLSPLAEGADRLFVDTLREVVPDARLMVPLPFDKPAYEASFSDEAAVADFRRRLEDPGTLESFVIPGGRVDEYYRLGRWVVDHADVMFFLHDGSDYGKAHRDGGTSAVLRYAWSDADLPGSSDRDGHPIFVYIDTGDTTAITRGAVRANPHARHLREEKEADLDCRAGEHQRSFDRYVASVVVLAFILGALVLLDWYFDGNEVFFAEQNIWRKLINWDSLSTLVLLALIARVLMARNRGSLRDWLESRYLAERLRAMPTLLDAEVPLSSVVEQRRRDPSSRDMARVWHSLYLAGLKKTLGDARPAMTPTALRTKLLARDSLFSDQIAWHLSAAKKKEKLQARWTLARNVLFVLSGLSSALAALNVAFIVPENGPLGNNLDLAGGLLSLLLAGVAAMAQVKEHGRIAARYRDTARRLAEVRRTIRFVEQGDGPARVEELREHLLQGTELLMETTYAWMDTMREKDPGLA